MSTAAVTLQFASEPRLYLNVAGEPRPGVPAVVLDTGLGNVSAVWNLVLPLIATTTRVCAYDRAGYGWSERGPLPRTSQRIVAELRAGLRAAGIEPPYVLVGHSFGGLNMILYAREHPGEVASVVLVDALSPYAAVQDPGSFRFFVRWNRMQFRFLAACGAAGLYRLYLALRGDAARPAFIRKLPLEQQTQALAELARRTHATAAAETDVLYESAESARIIGTFPAVPLVVLTHSIPDLFVGRMSPRDVAQAEQVWCAMQVDLAGLSPLGRLEVVERAGHHIHLDRPDAVVAAVQSVLAATSAASSAALDESQASVVYSSPQAKIE